MNEFNIELSLSIREDGKISLDANREVGLYELTAIGAAFIELAFTSNESNEDKKKIIGEFSEILNELCKEL